MSEAAESCPRCLEKAILFDDVQGIKVCEACGAVIEETALVQFTDTFGSEGPSGVFVPASDSGRMTGAYLHSGTGVGLAIQRSSRHQAQARLRARLKEVGNQLKLQPAIVDQALHFQEQLLPAVMGNWRRDHIVAASLYVACRVSKLPLSLVDFSAVLHSDIYTLGRHYHQALRLLELRPPLLEPATFLARGLEGAAVVLREAGGPSHEVGSTGNKAESLGCLHTDAAMLLSWMGSQCWGLHHPTANVCAAIVLAAEMNGMQGVGSEVAAAALHLSRKTVDRKLVQVRQKLLELSQLLPYGSAVTLKNVGSHARTLVNLSGVLLAAGVGQAPPGKEGSAALQGQQHQRSRLSKEAPSARKGSATLQGTAVAGQRRSAGGAPARQGDEEEGQGERRGAGEDGAGVEEGDSQEGGSLGWVEGFDAELEQYLRRPDEVALLRGVLEEQTAVDGRPGQAAKRRRKE